LTRLKCCTPRTVFTATHSSDNILIQQNSQPILLDFGAARQVVGGMTQGLTVVLKPGFASVEQYANDDPSQQRQWTDVYDVRTVLYYLIQVPIQV
jgi:serine/threonine protein kinase